MKSRIRLTTALVLGLAGFLVFATVYAGIIEEEFDADGLSQLHLDSDVGSVTIKAGSNKTVTVKVERKDWAEDHFSVDFSREAPALIVRGTLDRDNRGHHMRVRFEIEVPKAFSIRVKTRGGSVSVDDIDGEVDIGTAGGSISLGSIGGKVDASTAGGSITLDGSSAGARLNTAGGSISVGNVNGDVTFSTAGGSISIDRAAGQVEARTAGGSINVADSTGAVSASTAGGSISAYISQQPSGASKLSANGGGITVYLAENIGLDIDAHTNHGRIKSEFKLDDATATERRLRGKLNGGGPLLNLDANSSVRIVRR